MFSPRRSTRPPSLRIQSRSQAVPSGSLRSRSHRATSPMSRPRAPLSPLKEIQVLTGNAASILDGWCGFSRTID